jgi:hypothetical protein
LNEGRTAVAAAGSGVTSQSSFGRWTEPGSSGGILSTDN